MSFLSGDGYDPSQDKLELPELTDAERPLYTMFTENTGRHFLDSGGAYGRAWQRNRRRDLRADAQGHLEFFISGRRFEYVSISTYHFLEQRVVYNERLDGIFQQWRKRKSVEGDRLPDQMIGFPVWLKKMLPKARFRSPFGEEMDKPTYIYTYNEENVLSQDFQFTAFEVDHTEYVIISLHNGADARGGLTEPKFFELNGRSEWSIFDYNRAVISCDYTERKALLEKRARQKELIPSPAEAEYHFWDTDGGSSHFRAEHYPLGNAPRELNECRVIVAEDHYDYDPEKDTREENEQAIVLDKDGIPHCPVPDCGCRLTASGF